jgi:hypothetical protein
LEEAEERGAQKMTEKRWRTRLRRKMKEFVVGRER